MPLFCGVRRLSLVKPVRGDSQSCVEHKLTNRLRKFHSKRGRRSFNSDFGFARKTAKKAGVSDVEAAEQLTKSVKSKAVELGFAAVGVCPAIPPASLDRLDEWLARKYDGEMSYLRRRRSAYNHPNQVLPGAQSVVVLVTAYRNQEPQTPAIGQGRVSRYAWSGCDYHDVIRQRMRRLSDFFRSIAPAEQTRCVVDTAPLMERELARVAGLGWQGKNTLLLNRQWGSWFFLSELLTTATLGYDSPTQTDHCGTCRACLDACPTSAFVQPNLLDATRCISYLTIEHRSPIDVDLRESMGDWVLGCDVCQDVCPWNGKAPVVNDTAFEPNETLNPIDLRELFTLNEQQFRERFGQTPLMRPGRSGILRNAAIALGNQRDEGAIAALKIGLADSDPVVRGASAWALGKLGTPVCHACTKRPPTRRATRSSPRRDPTCPGSRLSVIEPELISSQIVAIDS